MKVPKNWNMSGRRPYASSEELNKIMEENTGLCQTLGTKEIAAFVSDKKRKSSDIIKVSDTTSAG
jgi:hypothetical protein